MTIQNLWVWYDLRLLSVNWNERISLANIYLLKINNTNTRKRFKICSKLTVKTPERRHQRRSGVFIVNFEHISHLFLVFLLPTLNKQMLAGPRFESLSRNILNHLCLTKRTRTKLRHTVNILLRSYLFIKLRNINLKFLLLLCQFDSILKIPDEEPWRSKTKKVNKMFLLNLPKPSLQRVWQEHMETDLRKENLTIWELFRCLSNI